MISNEAREAAWLVRPDCYFEFHKEGWMLGHYDGIRVIQTFQSVIDAERERCAGIAKTGWVSADYNLVGIADADQAMALCEHIANDIRSKAND